MSESASSPPNPWPPEKPDQIFVPGDPFPVDRVLPASSNRQPRPGRGRRSLTIAAQQGGHYVRAVIPTGSVHDIAIEATLRAAALRRARRLSGGAEGQEDEQEGVHLLVTPGDLRTKVRRARTGNLILFVVDASGSMGARKRMVAVKGAVLSLLLDAYQKRDRVGLIAFRGQSAELQVPPTQSVELAERRLRQLPTGGRTPLAAGLRLADQILTRHLQQDAALTPLLVVITDGRANAGRQGADVVGQARQAAVALGQKKVATIVLDSEQGFVRLGLSRQLAAWLEAEYLPLDQLHAEAIAGQVRQRLQTRK